MKTLLPNLLTAISLLLITQLNFGQAPNLGTTASFALFTAVGAFNNDGATAVKGDVGTNVGAFNAFPPGTLIGTKHVQDPVSAQAAIDVANAYSDLFGLTPTDVISTSLGNGQIIAPGIHKIGAAATLNGNLILDGNGDPDAIFIFQIDGALATGTYSNVTVINSASLCNVYWQINGQFDLGSGSVFRGTIISNGAINLLEASSLMGRGLSKAGAISLHNNIVTNPFTAAPIVTLTQPTCFLTTGTITVTSPIGAGTTYSIDGLNYTNTTGIFTEVPAGTYNVTAAIENGCASSETNVTVNAVPTGPAAPTTTLTQPTCILTTGTIEVTAPTGTGMTYSIDGSTYTNTTGIFNLVEAGTYTVTAKSADGCISSGTTVTLNDAQGGTTATPAIISADGPTIICEEESVTLSGNNGGIWSNGATTPSITVFASGDYFVTNSDDCGNVTSNHIIVTVNPLPICVITYSVFKCSMCEGQTMHLSAPAGYAAYLWSTGATSSYIDVTTSGTYSVTVTNSGGCISTCSLPVTVYPVPSAITGNDTTIIQGNSIQLGSAPVSGNTYSWSPATGLSSAIIANPTASPSATTTYTLTETNSNTGCQKTNSVTVTVIPNSSTAKGNITYQVWNNIGNSVAVSSLTSNINYPNNPTSTSLITSMEGITNQGDSYGARIAGYIYAPATGSYTFWIASDDNGELWLSTNDQPVDKQKIAYVNGFTLVRQWNKYATQKSAAINLVQGQKYYIEALMKEATGLDNMAVGWLKPGQTGTVPSEVIPGLVLSPIVPIIPILVSSVTLPPTSNVNIGSTVLLPATVLPANASNKTLNWMTSNPAFATVNSSGLITGMGAGIVTITATSTDGSNKSGACLVTVNANPTVCSATGTILYQVWNNIGNSVAVSSLTSNINYPNNPTSTSQITSMEGITDQGDSYGARIAGYICAPVTGSYTFWIASDDNGELWLSTNDQPASKQKIAYVNGFTLVRQWNKYSTQKSATINLVQGQKYYIEALMKEATGHDNMAVGWLKPGETGTVPSEVIPGSVLSPIGPTGTILYQVWNNIGNSVAVSSLTSNINYPNNPTSNSQIMSMEGITDQGDSYGARIAGYIYAPATGSYTFWIASDDNGELWLSTNDQPADKQKIAYVNGFTLVRQWNKYATQKSATINLVQGQKYYIEALMKEATGHDNMAVGWLKPGQTGTVPSEVIPGPVLSPLVLTKTFNEMIAENPVLNMPGVKLLIYPNPLINGILNIELENLTSDATLRIYAISGVKCYEKVIHSSGIIQVDRSVFKSGIYIIKLENEYFVKISKLIVN